MNRNHSLRVKTQQSQCQASVKNDNNVWMGKLQSKKNINKISDKVTSSMIQFNKQNSNSNYQDKYQSVCSSFNNLQTGKLLQEKEQMINVLKTKCKNYQRQLNDYYNQNKKSKKEKKQFNYTSDYYQNELKLLRNTISQKDQELNRYKAMYSSQISQISDLNEGITSRIQKQKVQKNAYIAEINCAHFQLKKLKEQLSLYKSQRQATSIVLKEKDSTIDDLMKQMQDIQFHKKKIQTYQLQLRESHISLKDIQAEMDNFRNEANKKDSIIRQSSKQIGFLEKKLSQYEIQCRKLEEQVLIFKENNTSSKTKIIQLSSECEQWKASYYTAKQELENIKQLQIKIKNSQLTIQDLKNRNKELVSINQKLKIQQNSQKVLQNKYKELENENQIYKKVIKEQKQRIEKFENEKYTLNKINQQLNQSLQKIANLEKALTSKEQQTRKIINKNQQKELIIQGLRNEVQQAIKQNYRLKQKQEKIDKLYAQNKKLHDNLHQKIKQIDELHSKIVTHESRIAKQINENLKVKAILETRQKQLTESESMYQNMKNRYETELGSKIGLEDKCMKLNSQIKSVKSKLSEVNQQNIRANQRIEQMQQDFQQKKKQLRSQISELNDYKNQIQDNLQIAYKKISDINLNIGDLKEEVRYLTQKQNQHINRIRQLQQKIIDLQKQLRQAEKCEQDMAKYARCIEQKYQQRISRHRINNS